MTELERAIKLSPLSGKDIAKKARVHYTTLWRAMKGLSQLRVDKGKRVARVVGIPFDALYGNPLAGEGMTGATSPPRKRPSSKRCS